MIIGMGIDIVELQRIESAVVKQPRFAERILTKKELDKYLTLSVIRKIEYLSGRFAAKEAFVKATNQSYGWHDIEVLNDGNGRPYITAEVNGRIHISISHSKNYAISQVIIESLSS
ncbi:holo-ACP synthase [Alkalihalobacillus pseudalcaliphilus]|uniref:holo-ACP synthase n=1 Tax=Alkalihalobacillus pseudalcaliphilus TaxID=79884 RepID=UPI00064E11E4|nr:holo-ACP synthase [Alkalihalobacillus pseudalcaliphilus]KMK76920.1 4'-phosphopantetheinyl transferase [Alkalihalobacillus pseudalcaliphilus]